MKKANRLRDLVSEIFGVTSRDGKKQPHRHEFEVDDDGVGKTTRTLDDSPDHPHEIKDFKVLSGDDGTGPHIHILPDTEPDDDVEPVEKEKEK